MKRSEDRILTTHVGSLIRPREIKDHLLAKQKGEYDEAAHKKSLTKTVAEIVQQQANSGWVVVSR